MCPLTKMSQSSCRCMAPACIHVHVHAHVMCVCVCVHVCVCVCVWLHGACMGSGCGHAARGGEGRAAAVVVVM